MKSTKQSKAKLYFTEIAFAKMSMLIDNFGTEIAWHGVAKRGRNKGEYIISDIFIYPQKVSGANVETDQEKYQNWLYEQPNEIFDNIRMQGHSHNNMAVSPSATDEENEKKIISQLGEDSFYIFIIANKKYDFRISIIDFKYEMTFELYPGHDKEIEMGCLYDGSGFNKLYADINKMVHVDKNFSDVFDRRSGLSGT